MAFFGASFFNASFFNAGFWSESTPIAPPAIAGSDMQAGGGGFSMSPEAFANRSRNLSEQLKKLERKKKRRQAIIEDDELLIIA